MKKIFSILAAAGLLLCGCSEKDEPAIDPYDGSSYVGTVSVMYEGQEVNNPDITVEIDDDDITRTLTIDIYRIKFVPNMPIAVNVTIPGVAYSEKNGVVTFSADNIVPMYGDIPMEKYKVSSLIGTVKGRDCSFSLNLGSYPTTFYGAEKK